MVVRMSAQKEVGTPDVALSGSRVWLFCFFGFAFARAWLELAMHRMAVLFPQSPWFGESLFTMAMVCAFVSFALFARKLAPLCGRKTPRVVCTSSMLVAGIGLLAESLVPGAFAGGVAVAVVAGGFGAALSIMLWAELHSCFEPLRVVLYVAGAFLLGSFLAWLLLDAQGWRLAAVLAVLPALSHGCLCTAFRLVPAVDMPKKTWGKLHFPWRMLVVLGLYQFVYGVKSPTSLPSVDLFLVGTMVGSVVVLALALMLRKRFDFTLLYRTPFVLMMCGLMMTFLTFSDTSVVAQFFIATGYSLMFLVLTILLCDISHTYGVSVLVLCGIQNVTLAAIPLGQAASFAFVGENTVAGFDSVTVTVVLSLLVVVATVALLSDSGHFRTWGVTFFGADGIAEEDERAKLLARCADKGAERGLSPREMEVLQLIALGRNTVAIGQELNIANGTLKSHTQRIYQKFGVHSRDELCELL
ncbi:MAG: helix-turn-helix transcriptional regulator [Gordonibacter sp.]|nr:helix-turn-helix transcriptional regulator [Gordonibacter sp.]